MGVGGSCMNAVRGTLTSPLRREDVTLGCHQVREVCICDGVLVIDGRVNSGDAAAAQAIIGMVHCWFSVFD